MAPSKGWRGSGAGIALVGVVGTLGLAMAVACAGCAGGSAAGAEGGFWEPGASQWGREAVGPVVNERLGVTVPPPPGPGWRFEESSQTDRRHWQVMFGRRLPGGGEHVENEAVLLIFDAFDSEDFDLTHEGFHSLVEAWIAAGPIEPGQEGRYRVSGEETLYAPFGSGEMGLYRARIEDLSHPRAGGRTLVMDLGACFAAAPEREGLGFEIRWSRRCVAPVPPVDNAANAEQMARAIEFHQPAR